MKAICVDTGVLSIYFSQDPSPDVQILFNNAKKKEIQIHIIKAVLCESFYHLCKLEGKDTAMFKISGFINIIKPIQIELSETLIYKTGLLKCQHGTTLSYIDCMSIAYCLQENIEFHSTEENLKKIPHNTLQKLKTIKYQF